VECFFVDQDCFVRGPSQLSSHSTASLQPSTTLLCIEKEVGQSVIQHSLIMIPKRSGIFASIVLAVASCASAPAQTKPSLDTTTFVVMGEGLAAGMANYGLSSVVQNYSFPAQMAAQMKTGFAQPLIQPPGIGDVIGYPDQEVKLHTYPQGSVRQFYQPEGAKQAGPPLFVMNLSVPGFTLADSVAVRPVAPIAQRNMKQTVVNMILGFPQLFLDDVPLWTQFEYAKAMVPTMALIELGYYEALDAAVNSDLTRLPDPTTFQSTYSSVLAGLRALQTQVIATTIPNPLDTAYFNTPAAAAAITFTAPSVIADTYKVTAQDYVTRNGLMEIGNQFLNGATGPLPAGSVLTGAVAADLTTRINALNAQIATAAKANGAVLYDLNAFIHKIKLSGATAGSTAITAAYLGGFYSLDAVYPGAAGHALIANDILAFLNQTYQVSFPLINVSTVITNDPTFPSKPSGVISTAGSPGISTQGGNR
jgi:hypothetical protein